MENAVPSKVPDHLEGNAPKDEEGLLVTYDVILCGTGLVQSILASALARAGKSVLHADAHEYYGELDSVWTLPYLKTKLEISLESGDTVQSSDDDANIPLSRLGGLAGLDIEKLEENTDFEVEVGSSVYTPYGVGTLITKEGTISTPICLDNWKLADGASPIVYVGDSNLANQGVVSLKEREAKHILQERSRGFALDATPGLLYASGASVEGLLKSGVADYMEFKSIEGLLWLEGEKLEAVPCNKNDVFLSKLLSPMDKRRLMKFLQLALDYGTARAEAELEADETEAVESLNERHLNQGRSLARPQNKAVVVDEIQDLEANMDMKFDEYLEKQKLGPKLRNLVRYALALESGSTEWTLREGMDGLCGHLAALGRFGSTGFLAPLYGSGELPQAFCRSGAVYGATYLLRRTPKKVVLEDSTVVGVKVEGDGEIPDKVVKCHHAVLSRASIESAEKSAKRVWRRICIFRGKLHGDGPQRHVLIIPPSIELGTPAVHGVLLDEGVNVAPYTTCGCSVLHLTTTTTDGNNGSDILLKASRVIAEKSPADEIFSVGFSYPVYREESSCASNLHVVESVEPQISVDVAFSRAKDIFEAICPGQEFLGMSKTVDEVVKERLGDTIEDEEAQVLDSAVEMIQKEGLQ